ENKNGKLDTGMFGIPTEGTVVSNHAKGFMGPPSFEKAKFSFAGVASEMDLRNPTRSHRRRHLRGRRGLAGASRPQPRRRRGGPADGRRTPHSAPVSLAPPA